MADGGTVVGMLKQPTADVPVWGCAPHSTDSEDRHDQQRRVESHAHDLDIGEEPRRHGPSDEGVELLKGAPGALVWCRCKRCVRCVRCATELSTLAFT